MKLNILIWLTAPIIFLLTRNPITGPWRILFALLSLIWLIVDSALLSRRNEKRKLFDVIIFGLFLVGATNWFYSPFFFILYFLIIAITLMFSKPAGFGFVVSLIILFSFNIGEVDAFYDSLVLISLLGAFPFALYLRSKYLNLLEKARQNN